MRLIDAKELERQVKEAFKENPGIMGLLLRWIRKQPTLTLDDIVPHGRWVDAYDNPVAFEKGDGRCPSGSCYCSECHEWLTASDEYSCIGRYCPNCGAKMDLEEEKK